MRCAKKQVPLFVYQQHVIHLAFLEKCPMGTNDSAKHCFDFVGDDYTVAATCLCFSLRREKEGQLRRNMFAFMWEVCNRKSFCCAVMPLS